MTLYKKGMNSKPLNSKPTLLNRKGSKDEQRRNVMDYQQHLEIKRNSDDVKERKMYKEPKKWSSAKNIKGENSRAGEGAMGFYGKTPDDMR